jgi:hypothetical protein
MKLFFRLMSVLVLTLSLLPQAWSLSFLTENNARLLALGDAFLVIEDESTEFSSLNHQNPSGLAESKNMQRLDLAFTMQSDSSIQIPMLGSSTDQVQISNFSMDVQRPGQPYAGMTYWLTSDLVTEVNVSGVWFNQQQKSHAGSSDLDANYQAWDLAGQIRLAYRTPWNLRLGIGGGYGGGNAKPDSTVGNYNYMGILADSMGYTSGTTDSLSLVFDHPTWEAGLSYTYDALGEDGRVSFGLTYASDNDLPQWSLLPSLSPSLSDSIQDHTADLHAQGTLLQGTTPFAVDIRDRYLVSPLHLSGEIIFELEKIVYASLFYDRVVSSTQLNHQQTMANTQIEQNYTVARHEDQGLTPMLRLRLPVLANMPLLVGLYFTSLGSGSDEEFQPQDTTGSSTIRVRWNQRSNSTLGLGGSLNPAQNLLLALQYDASKLHNDITLTDQFGQSTLPSTQETQSNQVRLGLEYLMLPVANLRLGYVWNESTEKGGTNYSLAQDETTTTQRWSGGLGIQIPTGLRVDASVYFDSIGMRPLPVPNPDPKSWGLSLLARLPL